MKVTCAGCWRLFCIAQVLPISPCARPWRQMRSAMGMVPLGECRSHHRSGAAAELYHRLHRGSGACPPAQETRADVARQWLLTGGLPVVSVQPAEEQRAKEILARHVDKDWTLCDAISFAVLAARRVPRAFTFDHHFQQYGPSAVPRLAVTAVVAPHLPPVALRWCLRSQRHTADSTGSSRGHSARCWGQAR